MIRFIILIVVTATVIIAVSEAMAAAGAIPGLPTFFYASLIYLAFVTGVMFAYLQPISDPSRYIQMFLLLTVVKLIACLAYCTVIVLKKRHDMKIDVLFFLGIYVIFTVVEVIFLHRKTRQKRP